MAGRPRVISNAAMSSDGKIALSDGQGVRLSTVKDLAGLHRLRASEDAILVEGGGTVTWSFLHEGLAYQLKVFVSSRVLGGRATPTLIGGQGVTSLDEAPRLRLIQIERLGDGALLEYTVVR